MDEYDMWGFDQLDRDNLMDMCSDDEYFDNYHQQMFGLQTVQPLIQVGGQLRGQYFYFDQDTKRAPGTSGNFTIYQMTSMRYREY